MAARRLLGLGVLLLGAAAPLAAGADDGGCPIAPSARTSRPDPGAGPTRVHFGLHVVDVTAVHESRETFEADIVVLTWWRDPRLASGETCIVGADRVWRPEFELGNAVGARTGLAPEVRIEPDGTVRRVQRYVGEFRTRLDLRDYPFDRQLLEFRFGSLAYGPDEVRPELAPATTSELEIAGWRVGAITGRTDSLRAIAIRAPGLQQDHVRVHYRLAMERDPAAYVRRAIVPPVIIVLMSFAVFWIDPTQIAPRLGVATTAMLSLIAFLFALQNLVPPVPYMTRLDQLVLGSLVLVFLAFAEAVLASAAAGRGRRALAKRIDRIARVAFVPALGVVVWIALA